MKVYTLSRRYPEELMSIHKSHAGALAFQTIDLDEREDRSKHYNRMFDREYASNNDYSIEEMEIRE